MSRAAPPGETRSGIVTIAGWTNVGKSTLLNQLVGEKVAAVADVPQTTRNRITGVRTLPAGVQIVFVNTPGLHRAKHRMNQVMVNLAKQSLVGVDVVLVIADAERGLGEGDEEAAALARGSGSTTLGVLNKIDRVSPKTMLLPLMERMGQWGLAEVIPVSAKTGDGCELLLERVAAHLPSGPFLFPADYLTDQPERALVAEWIREKALHHTRQELPHATAVMVERWEERADGLVSIEATIVVERESQKGIVVGHEGALVKKIGSEARQDIEALLGCRVFLRLWVKVRPGWRDDERALRDIGLA